jgi:large subunit ribosomal protein L10
MLRSEKERIVEELTERLRGTESLILADYRGLTMKDIEALRGELLRHGARFTVVKNSLTRRAAEAAGADAVLALLEGPTAITFLDADGDPVAVATALQETARTTRILAVRGGVLEGRVITAADIEELAKLPPADVLRGQVLGSLAAPLYAVVGLLAAPLQDLHGLVQARIDQLEAESPSARQEAAAEGAVADEETETQSEEADQASEESTKEE